MPGWLLRFTTFSLIHFVVGRCCDCFADSGVEQEEHLKTERVIPSDPDIARGLVTSQRGDGGSTGFQCGQDTSVGRLKGKDVPTA